jgi:hypothetical protein
MITFDDFINREQELKLFCALLEKKRSEIVLTVQGQEMQGKSDLLINYYDYCMNKNIPATLIDFKHEKNHDEFSLLEKIFYEYGHERLPHYAIRREQLIGSGLKFELRNIAQFGTSQMQIGVTHSPEMRQLWNRILTKDLLVDISKWRRKPSGVLMFDTYEKAPSEIKFWIENSLLTSCWKFRSFVIVIAGQSIPARAYKRKNRWLDIRLATISEDEWVDWAQTKKLGIPDDVIRHFWRGCNGNTGMLKTLITTDAMYVMSSK